MGAPSVVARSNVAASGRGAWILDYVLDTCPALPSGLWFGEDAGRTRAERMGAT